MNWPTWEELLIKLLPVDVYKSIRYDIAEVFSAAVYQYPPAHAAFGQMSLPDLQQFANKQAIAARNFDPHKSLFDVQGFFARLYKLVETLLIAIIVFGTLAGAGLWVSYSRGALDILGSVSQILTSVVLGGSAVLVLPAGLVLLYFRLIAFNSFIVSVLNRTLVIGPTKTNTRNEEELIGYGMWNSSLDGGAGLQLLVIFSVLWILSAVIPRRDPYEFIKEAVMNNIDIFANADGLLDATKRAFDQIRAQKGRDKEEQDESDEDSQNTELTVQDGS